jgi:NADH-quinone oxidoreductase subunit J
MEVAIFALFAALALASALVVVLHRNPVYSTLSLVVTLVSVAVLFVLLGAPFLAALQVLIYTGAIVVLFLFVIMLLNIQREGSVPGSGLGQRLGAAAGGLVFAGVLLLLVWRAHAAQRMPALVEEFVSLKSLARLLFTSYMLPFQLIGLLLLAAVVGATVLARRPTADEPSTEAKP